MSKRFFFERGGARLSYVDITPASTAPLIVALHGRSGSGRNFVPLAKALEPHWRIIGLDQRGYGWSEHAASASRADYVNDAAALIKRVSPDKPVVLLGHSLGGVNAYQLAGRHPELVRALIVEDIGLEFGPQAVMVEPWQKRWETLGELLAFMAASPFGQAPLLLDSITEYEDGWGFRFNDDWHEKHKHELYGDWSQDWAAIACPILLFRGSKSWALGEAMAQKMLGLNPRAKLVTLEAGHIVHDDKPEEYAEAVQEFLGGLK